MGTKCSNDECGDEIESYCMYVSLFHWRFCHIGEEGGLSEF